MQWHNCNIYLVILHKADIEFSDYELDRGCKCSSSSELLKLLLLTVNCTTS